MNESSLIDRLADTTSRRERDALDRDIVMILVEFLAAQSVVLYHLVSDGAQQRMVERARFANGLLQFHQRAPHDPAGLPEIAAREEWRACVEKKKPVYCPPADGNWTVCFPVEDGTRVTGLVEVGLTDSMSPRESRLTEGLLRILRNHIALLDYGERDSLTGLLNRRTFESRFEQLCANLPQVVPSTSQAQSWLGLLDIDRFKLINDKYGHVIGDEVLLLVSQITQRASRGSDQLFRFGGEEFVIVLENTNATGAHNAFERIRATIEKQCFPQVVSVTASLGFTALRRGDSPPSCVERADAALYFVKNNGRNAVRCFENLLEAGELVLKDNTGAIELF